MSDQPSLSHIDVECLRAEVERLRAERRWIPVEERLPELSQDVIICDGRLGDLIIAWRARNTGNFYNGEQQLHPTHWMPLPPLPGEEVQG